MYTRLKNSLLLIPLLIFFSACGGGPQTGGNEPVYPDIDQILEQSQPDLSIEDGTHLPEIYLGGFRLTKIATVSKAGQIIAEQTIDPSATIKVDVSASDPFDGFTALSNFLSADTIEVSGLVSLDIDSKRLIIKVLTSNTASIIAGETYVINFGSAAGSGFTLSFDGIINGEAVDLVYTFEKT